VPPDIRCVLVHPHMFLSTREARSILKTTCELSDVIWQTANLAASSRAATRTISR